MGLSRAAKVCRFPGRRVGFRVTEAFWGDGLVWLRRAAGMVDGVAQADVSGLSHKNDFALARSLGDRRDAR